MLTEHEHMIVESMTLIAQKKDVVYSRIARIGLQ